MPALFSLTLFITAKLTAIPLKYFLYNNTYLLHYKFLVWLSVSYLTGFYTIVITSLMLYLCRNLLPWLKSEII